MSEDDEEVFRLVARHLDFGVADPQPGANCSLDLVGADVVAVLEPTCHDSMCGEVNRCFIHGPVCRCHRRRLLGAVLRVTQLRHGFEQALGVGGRRWRWLGRPVVGGERAVLLSAAQSGRPAGLCFMAEAAAVDAPHRLPAGRSRMTFTHAAKALTLQRLCHGQLVRIKLMHLP